MIYTFLQKYHLSIENYYDLAAIGLCIAGNKFDGSKSKFSTYAYKCMFTTVFTEIRNRKAEKRIQDHQIVYYQAEFDDSNGGDTSTFLNYIPSNEAVFNSKSSVKHNHCKEIPNENEYEFYQWNGDPEDIKSVSFLKDLYDCFKVGCRDYGNYHLDYSRDGGIVDVYPGDYIINRENRIEICQKEKFEKKFIFR